MEARLLALLDPISPTAPCGSDLEYNPDLIVLQNLAMPQQSAQYGDFIAPPGTINWSEIEASLHAVLLTGRDIRALVLLLRCRVRLAGAAGARDGLHLLAELLHRYPDAIHPLRQIDGEADPAMQANALALLVDEHTVLADFRDILIDRNSSTRLTLRDVERSFAIPRSYDAADPENITLQLASLAARGEPTLAALNGAQAELARIKTWADQYLGSEAPDLAPLQRLLVRFAELPVASPTTEALAPQNLSLAEPESPAVVPADLPPAPTPEITSAVESLPEPVSQPTTAAIHQPSSDTRPVTRADALTLVRAARSWFEEYEPSSPVAALLRQAERLTGKPYHEIADAIPLDLLARWRNSDVQ